MNFLVPKNRLYNVPKNSARTDVPGQMTMKTTVVLLFG